MEQAAPPAGQAASPSALVVEDDALTRSLLRHALASVGMTMTEATTATQALAHLRAGAPLELALIDGMLPDMHGSELAARILDDPEGEELPLLFVTGALRHPPPPRAGVAAIVKPFRLAELAGLIGELRRWRGAGGSPLDERRSVLATVAASFIS